MKMGIFRAIVVHPGQIVSKRKQACGKCLQDNHSTIECMNDWVCKRCMVSGHKSGDCPMMAQNETQHESDERHEQELENDSEPRPMLQVTSKGQLTEDVTLMLMLPGSPKNYRKADRKLKHDKGLAKSMNGKTIQDYFISCDKTPFKEGDKQKLPVVHSPPTHTEELKSQKKFKMRDDDNDSNSESQDD